MRTLTVYVLMCLALALLMVVGAIFKQDIHAFSAAILVATYIEVRFGRVLDAMRGSDEAAAR